MIATITALQQCQKLQIKNVLIKSADKYIINSANKWINKWINNGWKLSTGGTPSHIDLWKIFLSIKNEKTFKFKIEKCRSNEEGYQGAVKLAKDGQTTMRNKARCKEYLTLIKELKDLKDPNTTNENVDQDDDLNEQECMCPGCTKKVTKDLKDINTASIQCCKCKQWFHYKCTELPAYQLTTLPFRCEHCSNLDDYIINILEIGQNEQTSSKDNEKELREQINERSKQTETDRI